MGFDLHGMNPKRNTTKPEILVEYIIEEGEDKGWTDWKKESKANYTNLPEGDYKFRVKAINIYNNTSANIVLSGGSMAGINLLGFLTEFNKKYDLQKIKKYIGVSVGSIIAFILNCNIDLHEFTYIVVNRNLYND